MRLPSCITMRVNENRTLHSGAYRENSVNVRFSSFACFFFLLRNLNFSNHHDCSRKPYIHAKNGNKEMSQEAIVIIQKGYDNGLDSEGISGKDK